MQGLAHAPIDTAELTILQIRVFVYTGIFFVHTCATMSGFVGDLSPQQEDALRKVRNWLYVITWSCRDECSLLHTTQLRDALSDVEYLRDKDDHYFLRWLRARKFNVSQSEDMLRKVRYVPY